MNDRQTLIAIRDAVNDAAALPVTAMLDFLGPDTPSASVQQVPGTRWLDRYVNGDGTRQQAFAVLYRAEGGDSTHRADAAAAMCDLIDALEDTSIEGVTKIEGTDTPSLTERSDDGSEVWRTTFVVESWRSGTADAVS